MTSVAYGLAFPATRGVLAFHASGFDPEALFAGDSGGWWDPSDSAAVWQDTSASTPAGVDDPVARIDDKSGNGNHLLQASSSARPTLRSSGGLWWLEFDGIDDFLQASFTLVQPLTRVSAARQVSWTSGDRVWDGTSPNSGTLFQTGASPNIRMYAGNAGPESTEMAIGANSVLTEIVSGASSKLAIDNNSYNFGDPGSADPGGGTVGSWGSGTDHFSNILWFGAVWIGRVLSDPEIAQARSYLGAKAGLSL